MNALAMASDIEWRLISERNTRGRARIKSEGIKVGRKHKEVSLEAIKSLKASHPEWGLRRIGEELGVSAPTIMRRLKIEKTNNDILPK